MRTLETGKCETGTHLPPPRVIGEQAKPQRGGETAKSDARVSAAHEVETPIRKTTSNRGRYGHRDVR